MFESLLRATVGVVTLPLDIVKDTLTLGGAITDEDSAVATKLEDIFDNVKDATQPVDKR